MSRSLLIFVAALSALAIDAHAETPTAAPKCMLKAGDAHTAYLNCVEDAAQRFELSGESAEAIAHGARAECSLEFAVARGAASQCDETGVSQHMLEDVDRFLGDEAIDFGIRRVLKIRAARRHAA